MLRSILVGVLGCLFTSTSLQAQAVPQLPPLLHVRFSLPTDTKVTLYQGLAEPRVLRAPTSVGLRPGYIYRCKLSQIPGHPGVELYPTLEVRGTLCLPPKIARADHPAPITVTEDDLQRALAHTLVTKVIYLEDPEKADPKAAERGQPVREDYYAQANLYAEAEARGRPVLILRLGGLLLTDSELQTQSLPNTILFPDEKVLGWPKVGPHVPFNCVPFFDPLLGPARSTAECFHDGGDAKLKASFDRQGQLTGLDPSDTVAEYTDSAGKKQVVASNRVCLCVPRFGIVRHVLPLGQAEVSQPLTQLLGQQSQAAVGSKQPSLFSRQTMHLGDMHSQVRASGTLAASSVDLLVHRRILEGFRFRTGPGDYLSTRFASLLTHEQRSLLFKQMEFAYHFQSSATASGVVQQEGTGSAKRVEGVDVTGSIVSTRDVTILCNEAPVPVLPDKPLVLHKWCKEHAAQVGDVVTFYLKYANQGGKPLREIVVSDSLTTRLEYVPNSAKADRDALFTTQMNEANSVILRWEIGGEVAPGESGIVSFQAKIR